jgi:hypothetical protein
VPAFTDTTGMTRSRVDRRRRTNHRVLSPDCEDSESWPPIRLDDLGADVASSSILCGDAEG